MGWPRPRSCRCSWPSLPARCSRCGRGAAPSSRPRDQWRQGHQDRLGIAAGLEPELGSAIVQQVELDVAPAPLQLVGPLGGAPWPVEVARDQTRIDVEERFADRAHEREVALEIVLEIVEEDPADPTVLVA